MTQDELVDTVAEVLMDVCIEEYDADIVRSMARILVEMGLPEGGN